VPDHLAQSRIFPQTLEVIETLAPHRVQNHKAFDHLRFVVAPFPLLDPHLLPYPARQPQRAERLHQKRHTAQSGQYFRYRLRINLDQQRQFGGGRFAGFLHPPILPTHPPGAKHILGLFPTTGPTEPDSSALRRIKTAD